MFNSINQLVERALSEAYLYLKCDAAKWKRQDKAVSIYIVR